MESVWFAGRTFEAGVLAAAAMEPDAGGDMLGVGSSEGEGYGG